MLSIQKAILLTADAQYEEFRKHLAGIDAGLPGRLVEQIRKDGESQRDSDDLCEAVYGGRDARSKRKFFQLVHHTFRLTSFLSKNYPSWLTHNISRMEMLVNKGEMQKALQLAEMLLDIADKIEDFQAAAAVHKFLAQQTFISEDKAASVRHHKKIRSVLEHERLLNDIYLRLREDLNFKGKNAQSKKEGELILTWFRGFNNHTSISVRLLSRYAYLYTLSYLNDERFYSPEVLKEINQLIDELDKNSFVVFSFSDDIWLNADYLRIKHLLSSMSSEDLRKESAALLKKREPLRFWKNYLNTPEIIFLSLQASSLLSTYYYGYRKDFHSSIPQEVMQQIGFSKKRCEEIIAKPFWNEGLHVRYINLNNIYCGFLLFGTKDDLRKAVRTIESLLVNYQQIAFHRLYDALFATLIMANFFLEEHEAVASCYKRYEKLTNSLNRNNENDLTIRIYYYASQWITAKRNQYVEKMLVIYDKVKKDPKLKPLRALIRDISAHYSIPLKAAVHA
jgi:hypothetical protein